MKRRREISVLRSLEYVTLSDAARILAENPNDDESVEIKRHELMALRQHDVLPFYHQPKLKSPVYRYQEVRRVMKACEGLKKKRYYAREYREKLLAKSWYREMLADAVNKPE